MKQLEQRVDTLIGSIAASGQNVDATKQMEGASHRPSSTTDESPPPSTKDVPKPTQQSLPYITPVGTPKSLGPDEEPFVPYDPVEAGVLTADMASELLKEFGDSFIRSFPFVVIPPDTNADDLRKNCPFMFLAIMCVTSYRTPAIQRMLNAEVKEQIAIRIARLSHKSLEILQGLLIYASW